MKYRLKHALAGIAATAALAVSLAAWSQGGPGGGHGDADFVEHQASALARIGKSLNLDASQQARLKALADQIHARHAAAVQGGDPRGRLQALIAGTTFDRQGAQALVDEKTAQIQAGAPALIAAAGDFFDSLDATQQQQVRDFMAKHPGRRGSPRGASAPTE